MQQVIKCSFCQKAQGMARDEAFSFQTLIVSICPACLNVCRGILRKGIRTGTESGSYKISSSRPDREEHLCCSFCDTPQEIVNKLIGSPRGSAPAYICDKCVGAGAAMIESKTRRVRSPKDLYHWIKSKVGIRHSHLRHAD